MGQVRETWNGLARKAGLIAATVVALAASSSVDAIASVRDTAPPAAKVQAKHVVASDADVYLDVDALLPPSYVMTTDERTGSVTSRAYNDSTSGVTFNIALGHGDATRDRAASLLDDPAPYLDDETMGALAEELELPSDQVSARNGSWAPVDVGVRARSSTDAIDIAGEGSISYEVVQFSATWRDEVAVGEVVSIHADSDGVDPVALAREIATRVASGPPTERDRLVAAGLVRGADLPGEWQVEPATGTGSGAGTVASPGGDGVSGGTKGATGASESADAMSDAVKHDRACDGYAGTLGAATATDAAATGGTGGTGGTGAKEGGDEKAVGPHFRSGFDQVQSTVWVSSERVAVAAFRELQSPAFTRCLRTVYTAVVEASLASVAPDGMSVDVTIGALPATGDDALMATVRVDLPNGRHVVTEIVFLRVRGAQAAYGFTTTSDTTVRSSVLPGVVERLEAAA